MHMADALVAPAVAGTMYVFSTAAAGYSVRRIRLENDEKKIPVMGVMGAFVFAAQMINFSIPGTGSSGHLCGSVLLSAILGPEAGFLTMIGVLLVQCLLFADGGLLALGANIWNMAFYGCFIGGMLIWKYVTGKRMSRGRIAAASVLGCVLTLQLGAFSVTLETLISGIAELPFTVFLAAMQPIHLVIGLVEGLITAAVLIFIYETRPELLWNYKDTGKKKGRLSYKGVIAVFAVAAVIIGGLLSVFASSNPDGLEWSMERVAGTAELETEGGVYALTDSIQSLTSLLPDYGWGEGESAGGTMVSGIIGGVVVVVLCVAVCFILRFFRRRTDLKKEGKNDEA
ncbi:MAG: energy-coupling factor ABC transporter permease [Lachnospiraceae bacterium]|nr:energy-coupling factor ABC transporter permease [Lachnospiraceae bacterium]